MIFLSNRWLRYLLNGEFKLQIYHNLLSKKLLHINYELYEECIAKLQTPYPSEKEKEALSRKTGLQMVQINNW